MTTPTSTQSTHRQQVTMCCNCDDFATRGDVYCERCRRECNAARHLWETETVNELADLELSSDNIYEG